MQKTVSQFAVYFGVIFGILLFLVLAFSPWGKIADAVDDTIVSLFAFEPTGVQFEVEVVPEKRVPNLPESGDNNWDSTVLIEVYNQNDARTAENLLASSSIPTADDGVSTTTVSFPTLDYGSEYDITAKAYSHLTRLMEDKVLTSTVDFTATTTNKVKAGDVNGETGDDKVNAIDVGLLVDNWGQSNDRMDLNQDTAINSLDISIMVDNFNLTGD